MTFENPDFHIVYVLTNEAMPGYIKVGVTERAIEMRMRDLYTSGVPVPFECFRASIVPKSKNVEKRIHSAFRDVRVNTNREFFEIAPERVVDILEMVEVENLTPDMDIVETPEDVVAMRKLEKRAERFSFTMVDIPEGALLTHVKDPEITCTVLDNSKVLFDGEEMSLSAAALQTLSSLGYSWKAAQGVQYWEYEGRLLKDIREEMENS